MENKKFVTNGCPDDKYFIFDGIIEVNCPVCGAKLEKDFSDDHIEYINDYIGKKDDGVSFWCEKCKKEFEMPMMIKSIYYTVNLQYDKSKLHEI